MQADGDQLQMQFHLGKYQPKFAAWLEANPHIWKAFEAQAERIWNCGRRHYSARTIIEVLRHESALREVGDGWKINNSFVADLARLYLDTYPERAGIFETRLQGNLRSA